MDQYSLRIDHQLTDNDNIFARLSIFDARAFQTFGSGKFFEALLPGFGRQLTTRSTNIALSHTHTFTPNVLNEARFGYLYASGGQISENRGIDFASSVGLLGTTQVVEDQDSQVSLGGLFSNIGDPTTFVTRRNTSYEFYDNVFINRGSHRLKFGVYLFHLSFNPVNPDTARGLFSFSSQFTGPRPNQTGNALADFLLGFPSSGQVGIGRSEARSYKLVSLLHSGRLESNAQSDHQHRPPQRD